MSMDIVSTGGSPYRVEREDGTVVSEHTTQHVAVGRAANESRESGQTVYVRRGLELRVTVTPDGPVEEPDEPTEPEEPDPEPEPEPEPPVPAVGLVADDTFPSGDLSYSENGFRWLRPAGGNVAVRHRSEMQDGAAPKFGDFALEFPFPASLQSNREQRFDMPPLSEFWLEYWVRFPTHYVHQDDPNSAADNNKFLALWHDVYSGPGFNLIIQMFRTGATSKLITYWEGLYGYQRYRDDRLLQGQIDPAVTDDQPGTFRRGEWVRYRLHLHLHPTDGIMEQWVDDVPFQRSPRGDLNLSHPDLDTIAHGYLMGAANSGFAEPTTIYVDGFRLWDQAPDWASEGS